MKLSNENENYAATVVRIRKINELSGLDNLVGLPLLGYQALTTKGVQIGDLGLVFTAETQLSDNYSSNNNLFRHEHLNADKTARGYLEDNRRIRAIKLRGHRSDALFMPLESLSYLGIDTSQLKEGDVFDSVDGVRICNKYLVRAKGSSVTNPQAKENKVDRKLFPEHFDTPNVFRNLGELEFAQVVITQKLHGTSVRIGNVEVKRQLKWYEKALKKMGVKIKDKEYSMVYGSRHTIRGLDTNSTEFYDVDLYSQVGRRLAGAIPKDTVVFAEIIGYVPGTTRPIQKDYTYGAPEGTAELYIYRVARVNEDGNSVDYSWDQVEEFAMNAGVETVPTLCRDWWSNIGEDGLRSFLDVELSKTYWQAVPTAGRVDEGVCVRVEGIRPQIFKAKSPVFLEHETKMLDQDVQDMESTDDSN